MIRSAVGKATAVLIPLLLAAACGYATMASPPGAGHAPAKTARPAACAAVPARFAGIALPAPQARTLPRFETTSSVRPQVLEYYSKFGYGFPAGPAETAESAGAVPLLQWIPPHYDPLYQIAAGKYDGYISRFAASLKSFGCPVILSFGHEFNGPWWPWGKGRQSAVSFVAAWRHIHDVFTAYGVRNVTWAWNPNVVTGPTVASPAAWWPGSAYVNLVALDGYYWGPSSTFGSVFTRSIVAVRKIAPGKPMFVAEAGAYPGPGMASRIGGLFAGARRTGLAGIVYFDIPGNRDWRLEDNPAALAEFRVAAKEYGR